MEDNEEELILSAKHTELVNRLCALFPEACIEIDDYIPVHNCWGVQIGRAKGVSYRRVSSSYESGPEIDWSPEIAQILCNSGFHKSGYYTTGCDERNYENYQIHYYAENGTVEYFD